MTQTLRPYQTLAHDAVVHALRKEARKRVLYTLSTGTGKTTTFAEIIKTFYRGGGLNVLVLAHRWELIKQAFDRIMAHCDLTLYEIGMESGKIHAPTNAAVVVGTMQTVVKANRLADWTPGLIIIDECHHASSETIKRILARWPDALVVGCTATPGRSDKASLFALKPDNTAIKIKVRGREVEATKETSVFEKLVFEYGLGDAIDDGYLVPLIGHTVKTTTDLSAVKLGLNGDFEDGDLQKAVDNAKRTLSGIAAWKKVAEDRPTIVFCSGIAHAEHSAELWRQAGYKAKSVNNDTDTVERAEALEAFRRGDLQLLMNCGLYTEGADFPFVGCVVVLRPTKSPSLYIQMAGRVARTQTGVIDGIEGATERRLAIAASGKPNGILLDFEDIYQGFDLCALPTVLGLPVTLALDGASVTDARDLLVKQKVVAERLIGPCPVAYEAIETQIERVELLAGSGAKSQGKWGVTETGDYALRRPGTGYKAELLRQPDGGMRLLVTFGDTELYNKAGRPRGRLVGYLNHAADYAADAIAAHQKAQPKPALGTALKLQQAGTGGWYRTLRHANFTHDEIDALPYDTARRIASSLAEKYRQGKDKAKQTRSMEMA